MLKIGDKLPAGSLQEYIEVEGDGCSIGPNNFDITGATAGKTIAIFGLPGAYTPTCSAKHVPGYVAKADALKAAGVDEIWCVSVNDAFVMGAWGRDQRTAGKVRMMADGSADFAKATGLTLDDVEYWPYDIDAVTAAQVKDVALRHLVQNKARVTGIILPQIPAPEKAQ